LAQQPSPKPHKSSSVAEGQQKFHLHTTGFEPRTFVRSQDMVMTLAWSY
jgi:hypothetical protein